MGHKLVPHTFIHTIYGCFQHVTLGHNGKSMIILWRLAKTENFETSLLIILLCKHTQMICNLKWFMYSISNEIVYLNKSLWNVIIRGSAILSVIFQHNFSMQTFGKLVECVFLDWKCMAISHKTIILVERCNGIPSGAYMDNPLIFHISKMISKNFIVQENVHHLFFGKIIVKRISTGIYSNFWNESGLVWQ